MYQRTENVLAKRLFQKKVKTWPGRKPNGGNIAVILLNIFCFKKCISIRRNIFLTYPGTGFTQPHEVN